MLQKKKRSSHYFQELINIKEALEKSSIVEITDVNGVIQYVNDKFCKISKYEPSEVIGHTYRKMKSGFHTEQFYKELWETVKQGKVWEGEIKNRAKDGTYYWVQTMIIPFINNNGEPYQYLIIRNDITDKKEAEKEGVQNVETIVEYGSPKVRIAKEIAPKHNADLIVCGATGLNAVERFFIGSVSEHITRYAKCDVLVVRIEGDVEE